MNTDCAFHIGTSHDVCQDYAIASQRSIAISDGCSSSLLSDIGARILSITALNKIKEIENLYNFDEKECILLARPAIRMLNIPNECLDATLLVATLYDHALEAICYGDGVIAIKTKDEDITIINCSYKDSYPFYINYMYDNTGRYGEWTKNHNKKDIAISTIKSNGDIIEQTKDFIYQSRIKDIGIFYSKDNKIWIELVDIESIEFIAIMSDGVHSFYETVTTETSRYTKPISYLEGIKKLLNFKNYNKSFVQRRMNKFYKDCIKNKWGNSDDLSLAVIHPGK